jgi:DNA-directed RNA polymerase subunit alpha
MPETTTPEQDIQQLLLAGPQDIHSFVRLRQVQAQSIENRRQIERIVVELKENPTLGEQRLSAEEAALCIGVGLWALGRLEEAAATLAQATGPEADYFTGLCYLETGFHPRALEALEGASRGKAAVKHLATLAQAEATAKAGKPDAALADLRALARSHENAPDVHYLLGYCYDLVGRYEDAVAAYEKALELDATHGRSAFRLGFNAALRGDEERAREHYEAVALRDPVAINALLNLGVLYEDLRHYDKAVECYRRVLRVDPTHPRARLYLKDAHASLDMVYDEDRQRELERQTKLLAIPVADFELSIRARNCLQHMNIYTLGELVSHTEEELLSWKNFGDTSLHEIKEMLTARGLRLGQTREDILKTAAEERAAAQPGAGAPVDEAVLSIPIGDLNLSVRSRKCMERLGIATLGQLIEHTPEELLASRNFGRTSLMEVNEKLTKYGLTLREPAPPEGEEEAQAEEAIAEGEQLIAEAPEDESRDDADAE